MRAAESVTAVDEPEHEPEHERDRGRRRHLLRFGWAGTAVALLLAWSSFTPSLLPRSPLLQGLVAGVAGAFGYGLGETVAWAVRRLGRWRPAPTVRRRAWQVLGVVGALGSAAFLALGWHWQGEVHGLRGKPPPPRLPARAGAGGPGAVPAGPVAPRAGVG